MQSREKRVARTEKVFIQVQRGAIDLEGFVLQSTTRDISRGGFNAWSEQPLQSEVILDVLVELPEYQQPFLLTAESRWCKPLDEGGYSVGFVILDAAHSDYQDWFDVMSKPHNDKTSP